MPPISFTQEVEIGGLQFEARPGKMLAEPYFKNKPGMVVHDCNTRH
jgi:hypothetical protein